MGICISKENCSTMYGYKFVYKMKEIKMYRYIIYEGVKFYKSILYKDTRISKDILYQFVINDIHTGKFLFTDKYNSPLICVSRDEKNKQISTTDIPEIVKLFQEYFTTYQNPNIIFSNFSYKDHTSDYDQTEKLLYA